MKRPFSLFSMRYWCPPLWFRILMKINGNIYRSMFSRYPLSDHSNSLSCDPLFIIGAGRSGTTLLRSMLVAGGQISITPETQIIHNLATKYPILQGLGWEDLSCFIVSMFEGHVGYEMWNINVYPVYQKLKNLPEKQRSLAKIIDEVFRFYAEQKFPNAQLWGEQSPIHTFYLPYIHAIFPRARYLHLLRDGRDVVSSWVKKNGDDYLPEAVYRWQISVERFRAFQKKMNPNQVIEIRYEDLVQNPEKVLKEICLFVGIDYSSEMLDYWKLPSTIESKYKEHHRNLEKPVFTSSIGRWRERLSLSQQKDVEQLLSDTLRDLDYIS